MENNDKEFFEKLATGFSYDENMTEDEATAQLAGLNKVKKETKPAKENILSMSVGDNMEFDDAEGHLTIDVYQDEDNIVVESAIAGINPEDVDISITPESVSIKGKREKKERVKKDNYLYQECFWGKFSRSIILPQEIDPDRSVASLKEGILKIILPKINRQKNKKVKVKLD